MSAATPSLEPAEPDWGALSERLVEEFPDFTAADVIAEIVQARDSANFVGTEPTELEEIVEFMVRYAMQVRSGLVAPSDRLQPMPRTASRQEATSSA